MSLNDVDLMAGLGTALYGLGRLAEADDHPSDGALPQPEARGSREGADSGSRADRISRRDSRSVGALGLSLAARRRRDASATAFRVALTRQPDCLRALLNLGLMHLHSRRPDEAMRCVESALRLDPEHPLAQSNWGARRT